MDRAIAQVMGKFKRLDILVNNAGGTDPKPFFDKTARDWMRIFELNTVSAFLCAQAAARPMLEAKSGRIINISSVRGLEHCGREPIMDYSAAKAAMVSFTMTLAKQLAPHVTVNAVGPGHTKTDIWKALSQEWNFLAKTVNYRELDPKSLALNVHFTGRPVIIESLQTITS